MSAPVQRWLGLVLLCAACSTPAAEPAAAAVIGVSGHGEVSVAPDRARLALAVDALDAEVKAAEAQVNRVVREYLAALQALDIAAADISTSGTWLAPEYSWDETARRQQLVGYRARREIQLMVRRLDRLGAVILSATQAGVNHVSAPQLESSRSEALQRQALAQAAADARARADAVAQGLGVRLGRVLSVREAGDAPPPVPFKAMMMRAEAAPDRGDAMGLALGEIRIAADVQAEFAIDDGAPGAR